MRDAIEALIRSWDRYEVERGASPVIDFDCFPTGETIQPAPDRLSVYQQLLRLRRDLEPGILATRLDADIAYLGALLGERLPLAEYIRATQGCSTSGWSDAYLRERLSTARRALERVGISWGASTDDELREAEGPLSVDVIADEIRKAASEYEPAVRQLADTDATYRLTIETTELDAYWSYWLDGQGDQVRLRLNLRNARFTRVGARQFALHEVLGHGLQSASIADRCASEDVPWVRLMSVHASHQCMFEGLAQAMPLFVARDNDILMARVRVDHYTQLVRGELHRAVNAGVPIAECAERARTRVPFWTDSQIADFLSDRGANPLLRSYLWAYPAGIDWFVALSEADVTVAREVLHAAYREPLTPADLTALWPGGPPIGGA